MAILTVACLILWVALCAYVISLSRAAIHDHREPAETTLHGLMVNAVIARRALRGETIVASVTGSAGDEHSAV